MKVDGVIQIASRRVDLDEFFTDPTFVEIRIMRPYTRAKVREIMMSSFDVGNVDPSGKASSIQTKTEGMADREMKIRMLKLTDCVIATNIKCDGANAIWGEELFKALDEADPRILEKVIREIDGFEGGPNPT